MTQLERYRLKKQLAVLRNVAQTYPHHSLGNVTQQIESRIKEPDK